MKALRRWVIGVVIASLGYAGVLAPPTQAAGTVPPGTVTLASGTNTTYSMVRPRTAWSGGLLIGFDYEPSQLLSWDGAPIGTTLARGRACGDLVVATYQSMTRWTNLVTGVSGVNYFTALAGPTPDGWFKWDKADGTLYRVVAATGAATPVGVFSHDVGQIVCNGSTFAFAPSSGEVQLGVFATYQMTELAPADSMPTTVLSVLGNTVIYTKVDGSGNEFLYRHTVGKPRQLLSSHPASAGVVAAQVTPSVSVFIRRSAGGLCPSITWHPVGGLPQELVKPTGACGAMLAWSGSAVRLAITDINRDTGGLYAVTEAGLSQLWVPPFEAVQAKARTLSAGRVAWVDNRSPGGTIWTRPVAGSTVLSVGQESALGAGRYIPFPLASGRRTAWDDRGRVVFVHDGSAVRQFPNALGAQEMSGHRILTSSSDLVDLAATDPKAEKLPIPSHRSDMTLWGNSVYVATVDQDVISIDLITGRESVVVTSAEMSRIMDHSLLTNIAVQGDIVAWVAQSTGIYPESTWLGWKNLRTGQVHQEPAGKGTLNSLTVYGSYVGLHTSSDAYPTNAVRVFSTVSNDVIFTWPDDANLTLDSMTRPIVGQIGLAWIAYNGEPKVTPLPDQHLVPRHEGNPLAATAFDRLSAPWTGEWVFTEPLTTCSVAIRDASTAVVRTLACDPTYAAQGEAVVTWDGTRADATPVAPGLYTWNVQAGDADGPAVDVDGVSSLAPGLIRVTNGPSTAYQPLQPARVLDTRPDGVTVDGQGTAGGALGTQQAITVKIAGRGGVPLSGVSAVAVNLTGVSPSAATFLTAYPSGSALPGTSTLNLPMGAIHANAAIVKLGPDGSINVYNHAGSADAVIDVVGYYPTGTGNQYVALTPARLTDTRAGAPTVDGRQSGGGKLGASETRSVTVTGRAGVPLSGVDAVVVNVTGVAPSSATYLSAFPAGGPVPLASTQNFAGGDTTPNLAVVKVGAGGAIDVFNAAGAIDLVVDIVGYVPTGSAYVPLTPRRALDTRTTVTPLGPNGIQSVPIAGALGIPATASAVVVNVTAVAPSDGTYLQAYPAGRQRPLTSTVNLYAGQVRANAAILKIGVGGALDVYNLRGSTDLVVDVVGYFE